MLHVIINSGYYGNLADVSTTGSCSICDEGYRCGGGAQRVSCNIGSYCPSGN